CSKDEIIKEVQVEIEVPEVKKDVTVKYSITTTGTDYLLLYSKGDDFNGVYTSRDEGYKANWEYSFTGKESDLLYFSFETLYGNDFTYEGESIETVFKIYLNDFLYSCQTHKSGRENLYFSYAKLIPTVEEIENWKNQ